MSAEISTVAPPQMPAVSGSQTPKPEVTAEQVSGNPSSQKPDTPPSVESLRETVGMINEMMQSSNTSLNFSVDPKSEEVVIRVMDSQTQTLVRQIPSEEALKLAEYMRGVVGILFDKSA